MVDLPGSKIPRLAEEHEAFADAMRDGEGLYEMIETLERSDKTALFLCVRPTHQFHVVSLRDGNGVEAIRDVGDADLWINGGFFVFRREIFDYLGPGEDLVGHAFPRLIAEEKVVAYPYEGFWAPMDTLKDKQTLENLLESGDPPWARPRGLERQDATPAG